MDSSRGNQAQQLLKEEWKSDQDYKRMIVTLELQNQKYRNELYELGETVNRILQKTKLPQQKQQPPNLDRQLQLARKELENVNQFIKIYQKELNGLGQRGGKEQMENITASEEMLRNKQQQLAQVKRQVKELSHKNKALQYKLAEYGKKNKTKGFDQQALQLKQLVSENKNLKGKLEELQQMQEKREGWLQNNLQNVRELEAKVHEQESRLPKIAPKKMERSDSSLPKLQSQKKIYTKWLESSREKGGSRLEKELTDLEKINKMVQDKIAHTTAEISDIEAHIAKVKQRVESSEMKLADEHSEEKQVRRKQMGCQVQRRHKRSRRDWVGKFQTLRFSDSRVVREEARIYKILFNSSGFFQFSYYSVKDSNKKMTGKLPFDPSTLAATGKESTFTVQHPDFIKNIRVKVNLKSQKITEMHVVSNLGIQGEFAVDTLVNSNNPGKGKEAAKGSVLKEEQMEAYYEMDVKPSEAISCVFGSYGCKTDEKKNVVAVWMEGIGVELIEDFVEELI